MEEPAAGKYARVERERRFLLAAPPTLPYTEARRITDRYLTGTRMRLRRVERPGAELEFKLTQKIPADRPGAVQGTITTAYLSLAEYQVFAGLPAAVLAKTRYSMPPLGVDVFEQPLRGLVLAEAEFDSEAAARAFAVPSFAVAEVTDDPRFTGGRLATATRADLLEWLAGYGITPA
ncbi:MAG: hypothetical protein FWE15_05025 [Actinomycetia bacterium]|nr:hypothetical protein [Actinomycetes bacterium]MCL2729371.1 hypothetical protein [Actinomycetes bacterium]